MKIVAAAVLLFLGLALAKKDGSILGSGDDVLDAANKAAQTAFDRAAKATHDAREALKDVEESLQKPGNWEGDAPEGVWGKIKKTVTGTPPTATEKAQKVAKDAVHATQKSADDAVKRAKLAAQEAQNIAASKYRDVKDATYKAATDKYEQASKTAGEGVKQAKESADSVADASGGIWQKVKDTVAGSTKDATEKAQLARQSAAQTVSSGKHQVHGAGKAAKKAATDAYETVADSATGAADYVSDSASAGSKAAKDAAAKGYKVGEDTAKDAAEYAAETAQSAKDAANGVSAFIQKYLSWGEGKAEESKTLSAKSIQDIKNQAQNAFKQTSKKSKKYSKEAQKEAQQKLQTNKSYASKQIESLKKEADAQYKHVKAQWEKATGISRSPAQSQWDKAEALRVKINQQLIEAEQGLQDAFSSASNYITQTWEDLKSKAEL